MTFVPMVSLSILVISFSVVLMIRLVAVLTFGVIVVMVRRLTSMAAD